MPPAPESQQTRAKDLFLLSCVKAFLLKSKLCEEQPEQKGDRERASAEGVCRGRWARLELRALGSYEQQFEKQRKTRDHAGI